MIKTALRSLAFGLFEMPPPTMPDLHDAVLERITVDWSRKLVRVLLTSVPGGLVMIICEGFEELNIPRREPWGPSDFVNGVSVEQGAESPVSITVEMQSGDQMKLSCESFRLTRPSSD